MNCMKYSFAASLLLASGCLFAQGTSPVQAANNTPQSIVTSSNLPAPLQIIPEKDIAWKKRVWRQIDANDVANSVLMPSGKPNSNQLTNVLVAGAMGGSIKAYSAADDQFTAVLTKDELSAVLSAAGFNPDKIFKYQIKEDWLFVKKGNDAGKMTVRIVGLAPVAAITNGDGTTTEKPLFWIYFPDSRDFLAQHQISSNSTETWLSYFENRQFKSKIDKVGNQSKNGADTYDNADVQFEQLNH